MLNQSDKTYIDDRISLHLSLLEGRVNNKFAQLEVKFDEKLTDKLKSYVDKDLFLTYMDKILGRIADIEQEILFIGQRLDRHEERITMVEEVLSTS